MHCSRRLIVQTMIFSRSYLHRQVSPPEILVVKRGTTWARNGPWILPENARLPRIIQEYFTCRKCTIWDRRLYFTSEGRCAEDFFRRRLRQGLNPRTWVPKASTIPVDHRSRSDWVSIVHKGHFSFYIYNIYFIPYLFLYLSCSFNRRSASHST